MAPIKDLAIRTMIVRVRDGEDVLNSLKFLATRTIPQGIATQMDLENILAPLSRSSHLTAYIHEILKKLDGLKSKKEDPKPAAVVKKGGSIKRILKMTNESKKRRSSGVTKKIVVETADVEDSEDVKENKKAARLFKKNEPKKKDSAIWKKIKRNQV